MFIVIDGTDGSGKATQSKLLLERLEKTGKKIAYMDFPRYGQKSAGMVEEYLNGKFGKAEDVGPYTASVFYALDRYAASFEIRKHLSEGKVVVANRYTSSNMGHQAGKIHDLHEREKFLQWLEGFEFGMLKIPRPDVVILLFMPPEAGQKLADGKWNSNYICGSKKDIHEADINHLKDAANAYLQVAKKYNWIIIDCSSGSGIKSIEEIHELVWKSLENYLD